MQATRIPYHKTNRFSTLVTDYLADKDQIQPFFGNRPTVQGFIEQVKIKAGFPQQTRDVLVKRLKTQYEALNLPAAQKAALWERFDLLANPNTYTVTTGHQLCLFTGPLYTVYKILHVIKLAEELTEQLKDTTVLPIFWMASEDHDFEEVNHIRLRGHKLVWKAPAGDAVGRMNTSGIKPIIDGLKTRLPEGEHSKAIINMLEQAYEQHGNLADATRALVHGWFGKMGIIVLDGDDAALKSAMIPAFTSELCEQRSCKAVEGTAAKLGITYNVQVNPREINLFYLANGVRNRIVEDDKAFTVLNTDVRWTEEEILVELNANPERFSPNVILRPLYQEVVLPNLGYIGGGGEVAYWAELKAMFAAFDVPFPIVIQRQSVQLVPKRIAHKVRKLDLSYIDLFGDSHKLALALVKRNCDFDDEFEKARKQIDAMYGRLAEVAGTVDETLLKHIAAQRTRAVNQVNTSEKKVYRAAKRNDDDLIRMLDETQDVIFPGGGLQERHDNIIEHFITFGPNLLDEIYRHIQPLQFDFLVLEEE